MIEAQPESISVPGIRARLLGTDMNAANAEKPGEQNDAAIRAMQERVRGTNICEETLLATDYLNRYAGAAMLIQMAPDMPDMLEELEEWEAVTYREHYKSTNIPDAELAVEAYEIALAKYREPLDTIVERMNGNVIRARDSLRAAVMEGDPMQVSLMAGLASEGLHKLVELAAAVIHGSEDAVDRIDEVEVALPSATSKQDEIDALFDD